MDKECCLLISRVACLAKLSHKPIGFTGPLSRILLCFHSFINAVRESLHDTVEMVLANMLLNGDISRDRQDWTELGLKYVSIYIITTVSWPRCYHDHPADLFVSLFFFEDYHSSMITTVPWVSLSSHTWMS